MLIVSNMKKTTIFDPVIFMGFYTSNIVYIYIYIYIENWF